MFCGLSNVQWNSNRFFLVEQLELPITEVVNTA